MDESSEKVTVRLGGTKESASRSTVLKSLDDTLKRSFDIVVSVLFLVMSVPAWVVLSVAIWLEDGRPVLYSQDRVGKGGRLFRSVKFRSMQKDSDARYGLRQAGPGDSRITKVGRLMRATGLDELPQAWNILRGDMSWVGPRALRPVEVEVNSGEEEVDLRSMPGFERRHSVRPGLTGMAQVYAPRDVTLARKFRWDFYYIEKRSFRLDLTLFALSCWISIRGRWEHRERKL